MPNWTEEDLEEKLKNPDLKVTGENLLPRLVKALEKKPHKYHVAPKEDRTYNGVVYHSKKEAEFARQLDLRKQAGEIDFYLRQVPFALPGGVTYRLDFMTFCRCSDDSDCWYVHPVEVKGKDLPMGKLKRKQAEAIYKIHIEVV